RDFFCLAEMALGALGNSTYDVHQRHVRNTTPVEIHEKLKRLKRLLHQYNKQTKINCHLNTNVTISLKTFLKKVEACADLANNLTR
ncbi:hypothetical protein CHARACLAT_012133, partial [Characodon lateralis]|nr:hypothetical protein [Characodon lateralis]